MQDARAAARQTQAVLQIQPQKAVPFEGPTAGASRMAALVEAERKKTAVPAAAYRAMKTGADDRSSTPPLAARARTIDGRSRRFVLVDSDQLTMQIV